MNWHEMTSTQQWQTLRNMELRGGSFANTLAEAWLRADSANSAKLATAFPELIEKYQPRSEA